MVPLRRTLLRAQVLTLMVWNKDLLCCLLNSVRIFIRSTSQRDTMILVTTFSLAPLLCVDTSASSVMWSWLWVCFHGDHPAVPSWLR